MSEDDHTGLPRESLQKAVAQTAARHVAALAAVGGSVRWELRSRHEEIEPLTITPDGAIASDPEANASAVVVRVDERVVTELMLGELSLPVALARNQISLLGDRGAPIALIRAWPDIARHYRDNMYDDHATPGYEPHLVDVSASLLGGVKGLPERLQDNRPDQMLLAAAILASLPADHRAIQWALIHSDFELGTIGMESITRLITSLSDFVARDSRHEDDRAEHDPPPMAVEADVPEAIRNKTFELNPTGGLR